MTTTRCILDLNDSLQIAMSEMILHFEGTCDQLREDGVAESTFFLDEQGVLQIKQLMEANREMTSTSSSCWPEEG
jgi:hypothetical protein